MALRQHTMRPARTAAARALAALALIACRGSDARPQLVLIVDTDAPVQGQLAARPELSADAAIDTLRIDAIDASGKIYASREIIAPSPLDWPVSLGVAAEGSGRVRLRLRAFRGELAIPALSAGLLEPFPETTIDRVVDIAVSPEEGVVHRRVHLALACVSRPPSFLDPPTTCIDAARLGAPPGEGIEEVEPDHPADTRIGTSPIALAVPCTGAPPPDARCIPGGYSVLGDPDLVGIGDALVLESAPMRPVILSPFWMDETEMTVGRLRQLLLAGELTEAPPAAYDPNDPNQQHCTWLGPDDPSHDAMPVNCVATRTAEQACAVGRGTLPSEAQWEHAARGRGQHRAYPWGDQEAECCTTSALRFGGACPGTGPEPVASHPGSPECPIGDVSRDGIFDLGGSLIEAVRDQVAEYDEPCWRYPGIALDPVCIEGDGPAARGGNWANHFVQALSALRKRSLPSEGQGFRCVYPDRSEP